MYNNPFLPLAPSPVRRSGIQLCYPFEECRLAKWSPPYIVQPKLDGDRCRADITDNSVVLLSSECNVITSVPHISEFLRLCNFGSIELDGELYTHGMSHELIHGIASRRVTPHRQADDLEYHIFDIVDEIKEQLDRLCDLMTVKLRLAEFTSSNSFCPVRVVPWELCNSLDDILRVYDKFVRLGYEGIIVRELSAPYIRRRSTSVMKFKPKKEDLYEIIGYVEEISIHGEPKGTLGALVCRAQLGEETFNVGSGFSKDARHYLWGIRERLSGNLVRVAYQHTTTGRGVPRFPIFCEIV